MPVQLLSDRGLLRLSGSDVAPFLQDLVTNDIDSLSAGEARFAALLTPQGKILFDFFVLRREGSEDELLLDAPLDRLQDLSQRLALYRLRSKVEIEDASHRIHVFAGWGEVPPQDRPAAGWFADPRSPRAGARGYFEPEAAPRGGGGDYEAHRIACALPKGGVDFLYADAYPQEANMDRLNGLSFQKGCYIGQEVISRMRHRGAVRTRVTPVSFAGAAPPAGAEIRADDLLVGRMGSSRDGLGLAMLRLDRLEAATAGGLALSCQGVWLAAHPERE